MIALQDFIANISEELSEQNKGLVSFLIRKGIINNENIKSVVSAIGPEAEKAQKKFSKDLLIDKEALQNYLKEHGLGKIKDQEWLVKTIIKAFNEANEVETLKFLVGDPKKDSDYPDYHRITFKDLLAGKNIFDLCYDKLHCRDAAVKIAMEDTKDKNGMSVGKYEILLQLMVENSVKHDGPNERGDMFVEFDGVEEVEVKASVKSGARVDGYIKNKQTMAVVYKNMNDLLNLNGTDYFKNNKTVKALADELSQREAAVSAEEFVKILINSLEQQFVMIKPVKVKNKIQLDKAIVLDDDVTKSIINYAVGEHIVEVDDDYNFKIDERLLQLVGLIQLALYRQSLKWRYIIVFDKHGNYRISPAKNLNTVDGIKKIMANYEFKPLGQGSERERSCRIVIRKKS